MIARYNQFVVKSRGALLQVNDQLRTHFAENDGAGRALGAYDSYVTKTANRYGAGAEGLTCDDLSAITDAALNETPSFVALLALAERAGVQPLLDGGACAVTFAGR